jgi:hypothetical protein
MNHHTKHEDGGRTCQALIGGISRKPRAAGRCRPSATEVEDGTRRADVQTVVIDYDRFKEP